MGILTSSIVNNAGGAYNIYGSDTPIRSTRLQASVTSGNLTKKIDYSTEDYLVEVKPRRTLSFAAASYLDRVQSSSLLSESEKNKLVRFITALDVADAFTMDEKGATAGAVNLMISLTEQANFRENKSFESMENETARKIIEKTMETLDGQKDKSYLLSQSLLIEETFFEMFGKSYSLYRTEQSKLQITDLAVTPESTEMQEAQNMVRRLNALV